MIGKCNTGGVDMATPVNAQTLTIEQIQESLVGKAQGANATADKILEGYSAYVGQELIEGTLVVPADYGEVTITEATTEITITHNLKRVPTKAVLLANGYSGDTYNSDFYTAVFINTDGLFTNTFHAENTPAIEGCARVYNSTGSGTGTNQSYYKTSLKSELTQNTVKFTLGSSVYSSEEFKVGSSYVWFVA